MKHSSGILCEPIRYKVDEKNVRGGLAVEAAVSYRSGVSENGGSDTCTMQ